MDEFVPNRKDIVIGTLFKPVSKDFAPCCGGGNRAIFEDICPCSEFERFVIVLVIILESKIRFFVWKFIIITENVKKGFLRSFRF